MIFAVDPDTIERLARHLRKNFVPGTTDVPWNEASAEERDVWCTEAAHFLEVAGCWPPVSPHHPTAGEFAEDEVPPGGWGDMELPPKWSAPRSE